jgi:DNA repair exonuclease SbcCD ATPase subunit
MDLQQAARMIEWLDEERRRDRGTIAQLQEQTAQQAELITQLIRRLDGMENEQSIMRTSFLPAGREIEISDQLRSEFHQVAEEIESKRLMAEREAERRSDIARESVARMVRDLEDRTEAIERSVEELPAARVERDRVAAALAAVQQRMEDLAKKFEEPERRITFLEEQRRQDSRRISDIQSEIPDIQKQFDAVRPKLEALESMVLRNEKRVLDVQAAERDRREAMQQFVDQQTLLLQQRDQQVAELTKSFGVYDEDMRRYIERFETWAETHRQMKKIVDDFERIAERLGRRINEVAEMQRLSEERFRQEWNDWNADDQKRWKQFTLTNDEAWRNHDKQLDQVRQNAEIVQDALDPLKNSIDRLWQLERARAELYRDRYQALLLQFDQVEHAAQMTSSSSNGKE